MRLFRGLEEGQPPAPNRTPSQPSLSYAPAHTQQANIHRGHSEQIFREQGAQSLLLQPITRTPPGAIDADMFTEEEKPPHVSFDGTEAPYDESAEYLSRLVSSADTRFV